MPFRKVLEPRETQSSSFITIIWVDNSISYDDKQYGKVNDGEVTVCLEYLFITVS